MNLLLIIQFRFFSLKQVIFRNVITVLINKNHQIFLNLEKRAKFFR